MFERVGSRVAEIPQAFRVDRRTAGLHASRYSPKKLLQSRRRLALRILPLDNSENEVVCSGWNRLLVERPARLRSGLAASNAVFSASQTRGGMGATQSSMTNPSDLVVLDCRCGSRQRFPKSATKVRCSNCQRTLRWAGSDSGTDNSSSPALTEPDRASLQFFPHLRIPAHREHSFRFNVNTDSGHREHGFRPS